MDRLTELIKKYDDSPDSPPAPPKAKILVIDDDPNIRQGLERTLRQRNYEVIITMTGQDGIDKLTDDVSVVLLDVKLPRMAGTEVYRLMKEKRPEVPIIFYSAYPGNEAVAKRCRDLRPYAFIEKGVAEEIENLYSLIAKAVMGKGGNG